MGYRVLAAVITVALLATGCGDRSAGGGGKDMRGKVFTSTSVTEQGKPRALVEGTKVELRLTDDGRLIANAGCNQMQAPVSLDNGKLAVSDLAMTAMGCPNPDLHKQDEWLAKLLGATPSWRMDGENLVITGADAEIMFAPEKPATLEGGTWVVDGLIAKDSVSSIPAGVKATVSFKDGHIGVESGCNSGSTDHTGAARYEVDGQKITFSDLVVSAMMCSPDKMAVESAVSNTFSEGKVTYQIDRNTLTLKNSKGEGLQLRK